MMDFAASVGTSAGVNDHEITLTAAGTASARRENDGTVSVVIDGVSYTTGSVDVATYSTVANQTDRLTALCLSL